MLSLTTNIDLFIVGLAVAGIGVLGFTAMFSNSKSITRRSFFYFSLASIGWSVINYAFYHLTNPVYGLWAIRIEICVAVLLVFFLFQFLYVFPEEEKKFPSWYRFALVPVTGFMALLTLTPWVFENVTGIDTNGIITSIANGPGIFVFVGYTLCLIFGGLLMYIHKMYKVESDVRGQYRSVLWGLFITFVLIMIFNLVFPAFLNNPEYISFGALFILPTIVSSAYAIQRYHLFHIKVFATAILVFFLAAIILLELLSSSNIYFTLLNIGIFALVLIIGTLLIKSVLREVEQREHIEKLANELEAANTRLKELDRLKDEFLSIASHQLRAPLTAVKGYISNITEGIYGKVPNYLLDPLTVVQESTRVMASSIEDYLNVSRIEQGRMKYEMGPVDFTSLAQRATDEMVPVAKKKGLELTFLDSPSVTVNADFGKLKQVFTNLIDNAVKYTEQGSVKASVTTTDSTVRFMTEDTGIGIAPEEIGELFSKFIRARDANKVNTTGTGLGLYVAKQLVEGQGGKVWAESDGVGKGSRFIVELPLNNQTATSETKHS